MSSRRRRSTRVGERNNWAKSLQGYAAAAGGAALALGAGDAAGELLYTDVIPDLSSAYLTNSADSTLIFLDVDGQTASVGESIMAPAGVDFNIGYSADDIEKPDFNFQASTSNWFSGQVAKSGRNYDFAHMFGPHEEIGPNYDPPPIELTDGQIWANGGWMENHDAGPWHAGGASGVNGVGVGFLGFRLDFDGLGVDFNYGWAQVRHDDNANAMTLLDFAIETDINTPITTPELTSPPVALVGDFNDDQIVDAADLEQWKTDFGVDAGADADGDDDSDGGDFLLWQRNLGAPAMTAAASAVPEPHSLALAALGASGLCALRRRRSS